MKKYFIHFAFLGIILSSCKDKDTPSNEINPQIKTEVQGFLEEYTTEYQKLRLESTKADWAANTYILKGDTVNAYNVQKTGEAFSKFTGSEEVITKAKKYLKQRKQLGRGIVRQLEAILYQAANNPSTVSELVSKRIKAENNQNEKLFGFEYQVNNQNIQSYEIDDILRNSTNLNERLNYWKASKEVGIELKDGLENLRNLRNQTVQALEFEDYFSYQISEYKMTKAEMLKSNRDIIKEIWPLYRELHTWARYELAKKYQTETPEMLPAHWLPNRWGQDWNALVEVEGLDIDSSLKDKSPEWMVKEGEAFYQSIGFDALPDSFYTKSSMYKLPKEAIYKKNNHASAWHFDLEKDVRCLMTVEPNAEYYETIHHELGHIYYYLSYNNDKVPALLRTGANRAYHEAVGSLLGLAAMQKPFLEGRGLVDKNAEVDQVQTLLKEALNYVVFLPFSAGVMTEFENDLYAENLPKDEFNKRWWDLKAKYQGISAPQQRGEEYCDAASKTHINNDAAQYYDYAFSYILLFQFHDHIAKNILKQDPHATNYYGNKEVGDFLKSMLSMGANCNWKVLLEESIGSPMSAKPMLDYFEPLMGYLKEVNKGRTHSLPEKL